MTTVHFQVLDVGQGMGHYTEIYEDQRAPAHTILADLGSEAFKEEAGGPSVDKVEASLRSMAQPTIDVLFLSHGDRDHHNLIRTLLERFEKYHGVPNKKALHVKRAIYGGSKSEYVRKDKKLFKRIREYMNGGDIERVFTAESSFEEAPAAAPALATIGPVEVFLLIGNLTRPPTAVAPGSKRSKPDSDTKNTVSLVLLLVLKRDDEINRTAFLITGDATAHTIAECNRWLTPYVQEHYFSNVFVVTAPHHGSRTTLLEMADFHGDAEENVREFIRNVDAGCIVASADSHYFHPAMEVLMMFLNNLYREPLWSEPAVPGYHLVTGNFLPYSMWTPDGAWPAIRKKKGYDTLFTFYNIYTGFYAYNVIEPWVLSPGLMPPAPQRPAGFDPPTGVAWIFIGSDTGANVVERWVNRQLDAELLKRFALPPAPAVPPLAPGRPAVPRSVRVFP